MKRLLVIAVVACVAVFVVVERAGSLSIRKVLPIAVVGCEDRASVAGGLTSGPLCPAAEVAVPVRRPAALAATAGTARADLIPRAVIFGNPERANVQISPDGRQLSWLAPRDGVLNIWVAPAGKLDQARPVTGDATRPIRQYYWAYTNRHILYLQDTGGNEDFHLYRVDLGSGKTTDLTPYPGVRAGLAAMSPGQPTTVIVSSNDRDPRVFDLYKVDLLTGERTLAVQNNHSFGGFALDHDMRVRFAYKMLADGTTQMLMPASRGVDPVWKLFGTIPFDDGDTTHFIAFAPGGRSVYMTDSRGRNTGALVSIDLATQKSTVVAEDARADAGAMIIHPTRHTLQAVAFDYLKQSWKVLDPSIQDDLDGLARLDGGEVSILSRSLDDRTWIAGTTSEQHPARYYVWDRAKRRGSFLFAARPELEKHPLVKMTPVEITARDGLTLVSYLSFPSSVNRDGGPADAPARPVPMVLLVHGGPWARDHWGYSAVHQMLANRGYAVLSVNYRGSTGFGKAFLNAGNLQWAKAMHDDLLDAVAWAVRRGVTTADRVCIMGGSYGGYATLVGLAMTPDAFRCGVDLVGPSNLLTLLASVPPYWAPMIARFHTRMGNPETAEGKALLVAASPLTHAANIRRPLLIAQGANDPRVKQAESEQIVAAMKAHRLPVSYAVFPDEGHGFARPENNIAFFGAAEAFLSVHLGGSYLPLTRAELEASTMQVVEGRDGIPGLGP